MVDPKNIGGPTCSVPEDYSNYYSEESSGYCSEVPENYTPDTNHTNNPNYTAEQNYTEDVNYTEYNSAVATDSYIAPSVQAGIDNGMEMLEEMRGRLTELENKARKFREDPAAFRSGSKAAAESGIYLDGSIVHHREISEIEGQIAELQKEIITAENAVRESTFKQTRVTWQMPDSQNASVAMYCGEEGCVTHANEDVPFSQNQLNTMLENFTGVAGISPALIPVGLEVYGPGRLDRVPREGTTFLNSISPDVVERMQAEAMTGDFMEMIAPYPLLRDAFKQNTDFMLEKLEGADESKGYIVIDFESGTIEAADQSPPADCLESGCDTRIFLRAGDLNHAKAMAACSEIIERRARGILGAEEAYAEAREIVDDIIGYNPGGILQRANRQFEKIGKMEAEFANLQGRGKSENLSLAASCAGGHHFYNSDPCNDAVSGKIMGRISAIDSGKIKLRKEIDIARDALRALVDSAVFHQTMMGIAQGGLEDELLSQAAEVVELYGFRKKAHTYVSEAHQIAEKTGNLSAVDRYRGMKLELDPDLKPDERIELTLQYVYEMDNIVEENKKSEEDQMMCTVPENEGMDSETEALAREARRLEYAEFRERSLASGSRLISQEESSGIGDNSFQYAEKMVDKITTEMGGEVHPSRTRVEALTYASMSLGEVRIKEVESQAQNEDLAGTGEILKPIWRRLKGVEKMYANYLTRLPEGNGDSEEEGLRDLIGSHGVQVHFHSLQRARMPFNAAIMTLHRLNKLPLYKDSEPVKDLVASIREKDSAQKGGPRFFKGDELVPPEEIALPPDYDEVVAEVGKMNMMPGSVWEDVGVSVGSDLALTAAGGAFAGPPGAFTGFLLGFLPAPVYGRVAYSGELDTIKYQAGMAGFGLAGLTRGDGDREMAEYLAFSGIGLLVGLPFLKGIGKWGAKNLSAKGLEHAGRKMAHEVDQSRAIGRLIKRGGYGAWRAARRLFSRSAREARARESAILSFPDKLAHALGVGSKKTAEQLQRAREIIIDEITDLLEARVDDVMSDSIGQSQSKRLASELIDILTLKSGAEASEKLEKLGKLLNRVMDEKAGRKGFEKEFAKIFGIEEESDSLRFICDTIFIPESARPHGFSGAVQTFGKIVVPKQQASKLFNALFISSSDDSSRSFLRRLVEDLRLMDDPAAELLGMADSMALPDIMTLLRVSRALEVDGSKVAQFELMLTRMTRDKGVVETLIESVVNGQTRDEVARTFQKLGRKADEHAMKGIMKAEDRQVVIGAARKILKDKDVRVRFEKQRQYEEMKLIPGVDAFFGRAEFAGLDVNTRSGRREILTRVFDSDGLTEDFLKVVLGKGLDSRRKVGATKAFYDILFEELANPRPHANDLRYALKDMIRPVLRGWQIDDFSEIGDLALRGRRRTAERILSQTQAMVGDDGDELLDAVIRLVHPKDVEKLGGHLPVVRQNLRSAFKGKLANEIAQAMRYTPKNGIFDRFVRPVNNIIDNKLGGLWWRRMWGKRYEEIARAALEAEPTLGIERNIPLLRKYLLRAGYLEKMGVKNGERIIGETIPGWLKPFQKAHEFVSKRVATEELRMAQRICLPVSLGAQLVDFAEGSETNETLDETSLVCGLVAFNHYMQNLGVGTTWGLWWAGLNRFTGSAMIKADAGSNDWVDTDRSFWIHMEMTTAMIFQNYVLYGLNAAEKTAWGRMLASIPFVRNLPLAMNATRWNRFFTKSIEKPDYMNWRGFGPMVLQSALVSSFVAAVYSSDKYINATSDYVGYTGTRYIENGPFVNLVGQWVQNRLEKNNATADLTSGMRQFVERMVLGMITQYIALRMWNTLAGKGDHREERIELAGEAAQKDFSDEALDNLWEHIRDRYALSLIKIGEGLHFQVGWPQISIKPGRKLQFDLELSPSVDPKQLMSDFSEIEMKFSDKEMHVGTMVEMARESPEKFKAVLEALGKQLKDAKAGWRTNMFFEKEVDRVMIYYYSTAIKWFAHLYKEGLKKEHKEERRDEYKPAAVFIDSFGDEYNPFWDSLPLCRDEDQLERAIVKMEEGEKVVGFNDDGTEFDVVDIEGLMDRLEVAAHAYKSGVIKDKADELRGAKKTGIDIEFGDDGSWVVRGNDDVQKYKVEFQKPVPEQKPADNSDRTGDTLPVEFGGKTWGAAHLNAPDAGVSVEPDAGAPVEDLEHSHDEE